MTYVLVHLDKSLVRAIQGLVEMLSAHCWGRGACVDVDVDPIDLAPCSSLEGLKSEPDVVNIALTQQVPEPCGSSPRSIPQTLQA